MKRPLIPVVLALLLVCGSFLRADGPAQGTPEALPRKVVCPAKILTRESLTVPVPGWDVYVQPAREFTLLSFSTGDPSRGEILVGDNDLKGPDDDTWLFCQYDGTRLGLAGPIGKFMKGCTYLDGEKRDNGEIPTIGVSCE